MGTFFFVYVHFIVEVDKLEKQNIFEAQPSPPSSLSKLSILAFSAHLLESFQYRCSKHTVQISIQGALIFETGYPKLKVQSLERTKTSCI